MNLGEVFIDVSVSNSSLSRIEKQISDKIKSLNSSQAITIKVDDSALTKLNEHLDLKVQHLKEVINFFDRNPIGVKESSSASTSQTSQKDNSGFAIDKGKSSVQQTPDNIQSSLLNSDNFNKKMKSDAENFNKSVYSALLSPFEDFKVGLFENIGKNFSEKFSKALFSSIEKHSGVSFAGAGAKTGEIGVFLSKKILSQPGSNTNQNQNQNQNNTQIPLQIPLQIPQTQNQTVLQTNSVSSIKSIAMQAMYMSSNLGTYAGNQLGKSIGTNPELTSLLSEALQGTKQSVSNNDITAAKQQLNKIKAGFKSAYAELTSLINKGDLDKALTLAETIKVSAASAKVEINQIYSGLSGGQKQAFGSEFATAKGSLLGTLEARYAKPSARILNLGQQLQGTKQEASNVGVNVVAGVKQGLASTSAEKEAAKVALGIVLSMKEVLGIKSPSQVAKQLMQFVGQGLVQGLQAIQASVNTQATKLGQGIVNSVGQPLHQPYIPIQFQQTALATTKFNPNATQLANAYQQQQLNKVAAWVISNTPTQLNNPNQSTLLSAGINNQLTTLPKNIYNAATRIIPSPHLNQQTLIPNQNSVFGSGQNVNLLIPVPNYKGGVGQNWINPNQGYMSNSAMNTRMPTQLNTTLPTALPLTPQPPKQNQPFTASQTQFNQLFSQMGNSFEKAIGGMFGGGGGGEINVTRELVGMMASGVGLMMPQLIGQTLITPIVSTVVPLVLAGAALKSFLTPIFSRTEVALQRTEPISNRLFAVSGSKNAAKEDFKFLQDSGKALNTDTSASALSYASLKAAAVGTKLNGDDVKELYTGISASMTAMNVSTEEAQGIWLAYTQILSKGKVSMEELRQQLGERFPAALNIFAEALGITVPELDALSSKGALLSEDVLPKVAKLLNTKYGDLAAKSVDTFAASVNRVKNSEFNLDKKFADNFGGVVTAANNIKANLTEKFVGMFDNIAKVGTAFLISAVAQLAVGFETMFKKIPMLKLGTDVAKNFSLAFIRSTTSTLVPFIAGALIDLIDDAMGSKRSVMDNMAKGMTQFFTSVIGSIDSMLRSINPLGKGLVTVQFPEEPNKELKKLLDSTQLFGFSIGEALDKISSFFSAIGGGVGEFVALIAMFEQTKLLIDLLLKDQLVRLRVVFLDLGKAILQPFGSLHNLADAFKGIFASSLTAGMTAMQRVQAVTQGLGQGFSVLGQKLTNFGVGILKAVAALKYFAAEALAAYAIMSFAQSDFSDPLAEGIHIAQKATIEGLKSIGNELKNLITIAGNVGDKLKSSLSLPSKGLELNPAKIFGLSSDSYKTDDFIKDENKRRERAYNNNNPFAYQDQVMQLGKKGFVSDALKRKKEAEKYGLGDYFSETDYTQTIAQEQLLNQAKDTKGFTTGLNKEISKLGLDKLGQGIAPKELTSIISQVKELDALIANKSNERSKFALIDTTDAKNQVRDLDKEINSLLQERRQKIKPLANVKLQVDEITKAWDTAKKLIEDSNQPPTAKAALLTLLDESKNSVDELKRGLGTIGVDTALTPFLDIWTKVISKLSDVNKAYDDINRKNKILSLKDQASILNSNLTPDNKQYYTDETVLNDLRKQQANLESVIKERNIALQQLLTITGVESNPARKEDVAKLKESAKDDAIKLEELRLQIAQSQNNLKLKLKENAKKIDDFYKQIVKDTELLNQELFSTTMSVVNTKNKNKLKQALIGFQDTFVTTYVDSIISLLDTLQQPLQNYTQQLQNLTSKRNAAQIQLDQNKVLSESVITPFNPSQDSNGNSATKQSPINRQLNKYKIVESVGGDVQKVMNYDDIEIHHPSRGNKPESSNRDYAMIRGRLEEIKKTNDNRILIVKDFILDDGSGAAKTKIPSFASGYIKNNPGMGQTSIFADPEFKKLIGMVLHQDQIFVKDGQYVNRGDTLGIQGGRGAKGRYTYGVHTDIRAEESVIRDYITSLASGQWGKDRNPTNQGNREVRANIPNIDKLQSMLVQDVKTGRVLAEKNSNVAPNSPASTIKLIVADLLIDAIKQGKTSLAQNLVLKPNEIAEGSSIKVGSIISVSKALELMLAQSDNTATNAIINLLGGTNKTTSLATERGYSNTKIGNLLSVPGTSGFKNTSTAQDVSKAMRSILTDNSDAGKVAENALKSTRNFGFTGEIGGKIGNNSKVIGNVGIVNISGKEYIVTAYANANGNVDSNKKIITDATNNIVRSLQSGVTTTQTQTQIGGNQLPPNDPSFSRLTAKGKKYLEYAQKPEVQAFLKAIAISEVGSTLVNQGRGYGKQIGGSYSKEEFSNTGSLTSIPASLPGRGGQTAFGRYQIHQPDFDWAKKELGISNLSPASQDVIGVQRLAFRGTLDALLAGDVDTAIKKAGDEFASLEGSKWIGRHGNRVTEGGKKSTFISNYKSALSELRSKPADLSMQQSAQGIDIADITAQRDAKAQESILRKSQLTIADNYNRQVISAKKLLDSQNETARFEAVIQSEKAKRQLVQGTRDNANTLIGSQRSAEDVLNNREDASNLQQKYNQDYVNLNRKYEDSAKQLALDLSKTNDAKDQLMALLQLINQGGLQNQSQLNEQIPQIQQTIKDLTKQSIEFDSLLTHQTDLKQIELKKLIAQYEIDKQAVAFETRQREGNTKIQRLNNEADIITSVQRNVADFRFGDPLKVKKEASDLQLQLEVDQQINDMKARQRTGNFRNENFGDTEQAIKNSGYVARNRSNMEYLKNVEDRAREIQKLQDEFENKQSTSQSNLLGGKSDYLSSRGLNITAESFAKQKAILDQTTSYNTQMKDLDEYARTSGNSVKTLKDELTQLNELSLSKINAQFDPWVKVTNSAIEGLSGGIEGLLNGTMSLGDAFNTMGQSISKTLAKLAADWLTNELVNSLFGLNKKEGMVAQTPSFGGSSGGGTFGFIGSLLGGILGFASGGDVPSHNFNALRNSDNPIGQALKREGSNSVLATLTPGERVLTVEENNKLRRMMDSANGVLSFKDGGTVPGVSTGSDMSQVIANKNTSINIDASINSSGKSPDERDMANAIRAVVISELNKRERQRR